MAEYRATKLIRMCDRWPSQWDVVALPQCLYIVYRHGCLTVQEDHGDELGDEIFEKQCRASLPDEMTDAAMMGYTKDLIDWSMLTAGNSERFESVTGTSKPPE